MWLFHVASSKWELPCYPHPSLSYEGRREQKGSSHFDKTLSIWHSINRIFCIFFICHFSLFFVLSTLIFFYQVWFHRRSRVYWIVVLMTIVSSYLFRSSRSFGKAWCGRCRLWWGCWWSGWWCGGFGARHWRGRRGCRGFYRPPFTPTQPSQPLYFRTIHFPSLLSIAIVSWKSSIRANWSTLVTV